MEIRLRAVVVFFFVLFCLSFTSRLLAQSLEEKADQAARDADNSARQAASAALKAFEAVERARNLAREISEEAGLELPEIAPEVAPQIAEPILPEEIQLDEIPVNLEPEPKVESIENDPLLPTDEKSIEPETTVEATPVPQPSQPDGDGDSYTSAKAIVPCPVESCPRGNLETGYATDYFFRGVRLAEDVVFGDFQYTFDHVTVGASHISDLSSQNQPFGEQSTLYASVDLPLTRGFDLKIGYDQYFYPNQPIGSHGAIGLQVTKEMARGLSISAQTSYDLNVPNNFRGVTANQDEAWIHEFEVSQKICLNHSIGLELSGGVLVTDGVWDNGRSSGWNSYYARAELPVCLTKCATLTPFIAYNGSPDSWIADGVNADFDAATNDNDALYGGISLSVSF